MFHYFQGTIKTFGDETYIINEQAGIQIYYQPTTPSSWANAKDSAAQKNQKASGQELRARSLFLHPYIDDNNKTIRYYAFDKHTQKQVFTNLTKITGIGPKTAFHIAQIPQKDIQQAIKDLNVKFFQNIPWIGPKSAKKILFELKDTIKHDDLQRLAIDEKLLKKITTTLKSLGYEAKKVNTTLHKYNKPITEDTLSDVIKWMIKHI